MVKELAHIQYAPDVIFLAKYPSNCNCEENVVISVINICQHTLDKNIITSYYRLLAETIIYFFNKNIKVTLVSFCKREGDEVAIKILLNKIPFSNNVSTCFYDGNIEEILKLFANSSFVIASRFHSFILGILFNKPVFPIVYNCKTENYLFDLPFDGKYAKLNDLLTLRMEDILFNYENKIITDCSDHKRYASNQFWGLRKYLNEKV